MNTVQLPYTPALIPTEATEPPNLRKLWEATHKMLQNTKKRRRHSSEKWAEKSGRLCTHVCVAVQIFACALTGIHM